MHREYFSTKALWDGQSDGMQKTITYSLRVLWLAILLLSGVWLQGQTRYIATNDDSAFPFLTGVSFFAIGPTGALTFQQDVPTGGFGIGGGYFGANRVVAASDGSENCVYASEAGDGEIVGISVETLTVGGSATGSSTDTGTSNGIGLLVENGYLYASFTDSNTIGTFKIESGCGLMFIDDTDVKGLNGGVINAMAAQGHILVASFTDGSIESFDLSSGTPVSNGDEQISSAAVRFAFATYPNQVEITKDGHFAIFGDTSTSMVVEVSDLSSGVLSKTVVYASNRGISSSTIRLSPDESVLYVVNTQGDGVTAYFLNSNTGALTYGCRSGPIRGQSASWSYLANARLRDQTGNGGAIYVAEFGSVPGIALINFTASSNSCTLQEGAGSPYADTNSSLLSIETVSSSSF